MSELKEVAEDIISVKIGILAGSRKMVSLYHEFNLEDDSFNVFRALDSETDDCLLDPIEFPISDQRREKLAEN